MSPAVLYKTADTFDPSFFDLNRSKSDVNMPKRKIKYSSRTAFWPCGSCRQNCRDKSTCLLCETCNMWFHCSCESLSAEDFCTFSSGSIPFVCLDCLKQEKGDDYSYQSALIRLSQAALNGYSFLALAARREVLLMPSQSMPESVPVQHNKLSIDRNSKYLLDNYTSLEYHAPLLVSANGNCLFNAISVSLYGDESYAQELRVKTCLEMVRNPDKYKLHQNYTNLLLVSPSYEEACLECSKDGRYSSAWTMMAASTVIGRPIKSVYPSANGEDLPFQTLNADFYPRHSVDSQPICIMWTRTCARSDSVWTPNHFVPLIELQNCTNEVEELITEDSSITLDEDEFMFTGNCFVNSHLLSSTFEEPANTENLVHVTENSDCNSTSDNIVYMDGMNCDSVFLQRTASYRRAHGHQNNLHKISMLEIILIRKIIQRRQMFRKIKRKLIYKCKC